MIITVDDILIPSVDDEDRQRNLKEVLLCLAKSGLRLKQACVRLFFYNIFFISFITNTKKLQHKIITYRE